MTMTEKQKLWRKTEAYRAQRREYMRAYYAKNTKYAEKQIANVLKKRRKVKKTAFTKKLEALYAKKLLIYTTIFC